MRRFLSMVIILVAGTAAFAADNPPPALYLQIVRGAKDDKTKAQGWKPIGPKLAKRLKRVVPWNYYWETSVREIAPSKGKLRSIEIAPGRKLEIVWGDAQHADLCMYRDGVMRRKSRVSLSSGMTIMGGDATGDEGWFVVVRNDKPSVN
jgi:hypothetical protein